MWEIHFISRWSWRLPRTCTSYEFACTSRKFF